MFNLIRRISYGVIPRPDRPWEEDPTSNAPRTQRKRRLSSTERDADEDDDKINQKKLRIDSESSSVADTPAASTSASVPPPQNETQEVKEVTEGVKEVDLEDKQDEDLPAPESVPLPEETSDELDDPAPAADENASSAASSRQNSAEPQHQDGSDGTITKEVIDVDHDEEEEVPSAVQDATLSKSSKAGKQESIDSSDADSPAVEES